MKRCAIAISSTTPSNGDEGGLGSPKRLFVRSPLRLAGPLALVVLAACEPMFVLAGGALSGIERPLPTDWDFAQGVNTVQLETRPADPYSVNVWGVGLGSNFYVAASDGADSWWTQAIEADPHVRLRIDEHVYPLAARRVDDGIELAEVVEAYVSKYDVDPEDSFVRNAWVYRLGAR